jgi:ABC-type polysaccharide/polyol phosphate transport system ATPase subunit
MPGEPLVELHHVARRFEKKLDRNRSLQDLFIRLFRGRKAPVDAFWPLRDLSLAIYPGESVGIIGANGSGKSTLLKLITGILEPTQGDLVVRGRISSLLELGAGFQPELTGRENIYLNGSIYGMSRRQMDARVDDIIAYAELGDFIDTPVKHFSSGMYVRLGFAVAIFTEPELLLVDEVLAVGDTSFHRKCLNSIQDFRDRGGTLLLVSHDVNAIQNICRRAIWLYDGEIAAQGNPTDIVMAYLNHVAEQEEQKRRDTEPATPPVDAPAQRWGSGQIRITAVELLDEVGEPRTICYTGAPLTIRLHYHAPVPVAAPIFGIGIHDRNGAHVSGPNTRFAGLDIPVVAGEGTIRYTIPALPLLEGQYALSVAVVNAADSETYDYHDRLYHFEVYPGQSAERYGLVTLGGAWQLEDSAGRAVSPGNTASPGNVEGSGARVPNAVSHIGVD